MLTNEQHEQLSRPFPIASHKFRVMRKSRDGKKAMYYTYLDARDVQVRLSEVDPGWSSEFAIVQLDNSIAVVECRLTVCGTTRMDVGTGTRNTNRDGEFIDNDGNYVKGAYSDALKRAAVNFGVGAYLYRLSSIYEPIDQYGNFTDAALKSMRKRLLADISRIFPNGPTVPASIPQPEPAPVPRGVEELTSLDQVDELEFDAIPDAQAASAAQAAAVERLWARLREQETICARMVQRLRAQEGGRKCTTKQYGFLVGLVDGLTQDGAHRALLHLLTGHPVDKERRLSANVASKLIGALNPDDDGYWAEGAECVKVLWRQVQEEMGQGVLV